MNSGKIGLLGGTFDPVHNGHLQLAASALEECCLEKVVFIPSAEPPHKIGASISSFTHRLAMLALACNGREGFECNAIEGMLAKPSYTIDTLRTLRAQYSSECQLFFMIGADAFLDILTWKTYQEILQSVNIILSRRKGYQAEQLQSLLEKLDYQQNDTCWSANDGKKDIYILHKIPEDYSSSKIRTMIRKGEPVHRFLPQAVFEYIGHNKLYLADKQGKLPATDTTSRVNVER